MSHLVVKAVRSWWERRSFLRLPWRLHASDPNWVPPLRRAQKELVGYGSHPFYRNAEAQTFLALRGGKPCGRIAAILNRAHNEAHRERRGFFGFFESIDDEEVARGLFDAVRQWFAERGIVSLRGPVNPSLNYECGLLVEGFDTPPTFMTTYNPPYYGRLIEAAGFRKSQDLYAYTGRDHMLGTRQGKIAVIAEQATQRFQAITRRIETGRFREEARMFLNIYNRSLVNTWGFVPLSAAEMDHLSAEMTWLIVPELTSVVEVDGRPVGVNLGLLDYNPLIKKSNGRLFPFGLLRLLRGRRHLQRVRVLSTNVLPEYQSWGLGIVLQMGMLPARQAWPALVEAEYSWVLESNHLSRATLERAGTIRTKTYRLYDFEPARAQSARLAA